MSRRRKLLVLGICCMSLLIASMDATIINVALPSISKDLGAPISGVQWTIDAFVVVLASFLLLSGSTADRVGRRRIFQIGLTIFVGGSLLCSLAPSVGWLVAFRMVQALGGSMLNPVAMSIITNVFTEPRERARAIGFWGGVSGIGIGLGPLVGGMLVEFVGWRAIFWINLPIGLVALTAAALFVPDSRSPHPRRFDPLGQLAMVVLLASCVYAIIEAPRAGWLSAQTISLFVLTAGALTVLLIYEPRRADPLIELRFFRSVPFAGAILIAISAFGAFGGFLFMNTLYLQAIRGLSPMQAGLCTVPIGLTVLICSPISGRVVGRYGPRPSLLLAGTMICLGACMLLFVTPGTALGYVLASYLAFGVGQRCGQRADHEHSGVGDATQPRRCRRGSRDDQSQYWHQSWRCDRRIDLELTRVRHGRCRFHRGRPSCTVGDRGLGLHRVRRRRRLHHGQRATHRAADRAPVSRG